jgi:hypothetical protein
VSDDIVAFIRARLDEDAERAQGAIGDQWQFRTKGGHAYIARRDADPLSAVAEAGDTQTGWHIARHDPDRVLRGVEAKRKIVAELERSLTLDQTRPDVHQSTGWLMWTMVQFASEWSTHPDYRQEWQA